MNEQHSAGSSKDEVERWKLIPERIAELRNFVDEILSAHNTYSCIAIRDMLSEALRPIVETPQPASAIFDWSKPTGGYMAEAPQSVSNERCIPGTCCRNDLLTVIERLTDRASHETPAAPSRHEVLESIRAGRVTYPPEVTPTGRWMPADDSHLRSQPAQETDGNLTVPLKVYNALKVDRDDWRDRALSAERSSSETVAQPSQDERTLRRLLASAYSGTNLYRDDGELQDGSDVPVIDYLRDPVSVIEGKIQERGLRKLAKANAQNGLSAPSKEDER